MAPLTARFTRRGGRLWDLVPSGSTGPPQHYVVHAWGAKLVEVVDQLVHSLTLHGEGLRGEG